MDVARNRLRISRRSSLNIKTIATAVAGNKIAKIINQGYYLPAF